MPCTPGIQMNVPAIDHNALPPNITPSSSLGTLSTTPKRGKTLPGAPGRARAFVSGGGGGSIEPSGYTPPPASKRARLTGLPKSYQDGPPGPRGDPGPTIGKK